ncbi:replicative DNA helicase [Hypnocyclicus thermotrophus]|uniref:Replicative DNA helicase n=1 Tax=Hypnocyclicus thermotrophus TaxID=1627895 RepID=A0AA46DZ38_9FUSO|nr:replicative DNA helicase [Hypnocyclicus thermotrophus]TDT71484.1 replicative DNA helicase [Hypnocyclicus thermotrophus]
MEVESLNRVPYSEEAEKSVLGGILLKQDALSDIIDILRPNDFYKLSHKYIYEAMLNIYSHGEVIDPVVLINSLKKMDRFDEIGGENIIYEILDEVPTAANILSYAKIVKEKSILRELINVGNKVVELAQTGYEEVDSILDKAEGLIFKISESKENKEVVSISSLVNEEFERLEKVVKNSGATTGISSNFKEFDQMTSGFHPSDLVIIAARPSMGKTAFVLNLALNAALNENKSVLIFSLEMSNSQIFQRLLAIESKIPLNKIRNGFISEDEWGHIALATGKLANTDIQIADVPNVTVLEIRAMARRLKAAGKLDMILIDYLQLIKGSGRTESRQQEISDISRSLKGIARELDVPVIALSQLSRAPEQRADRRPMLSDLRDSGAIEQDADMVVFLYRDEYYNEDSEDKGLAEIIIGKQRNGPVGTITLKYFNEITKFADYTAQIK